MPNQHSLSSKPRTMKELASAYSVSVATFRHWLRRNPQTRLLFMFRTGYYFTPRDVRCIMEAFGEP